MPHQGGGDSEKLMMKDTRWWKNHLTDPLRAMNSNPDDAIAIHGLEPREKNELCLVKQSNACQSGASACECIPKRAVRAFL